MSQAFGLYLTAVGAAIVFATLLLIALASEVTKRVFSVEEPELRRGKLKKVAALAAIYHSMERDARTHTKLVEMERRSNWAAVARIEALDRGVGRDR